MTLDASTKCLHLDSVLVLTRICRKLVYLFSLQARFCTIRRFYDWSTHAHSVVSVAVDRDLIISTALFSLLISPANIVLVVICSLLFHIPIYVKILVIKFLPLLREVFSDLGFLT